MTDNDRIERVILKMRKLFSKLVAMLTATAILGTMISTYPVSAAAKDKNTEASIDERVDRMIAGMTTEQKLAQMMIVSLRSGGKNTTAVSKAYEKILKKYDFGGFILFAGSIADTEQTVTLIRKCQSAAMKSKNGIPMFVCVDQEGGLVNRVSFGTTSSGNMGLAATSDVSLTEESADMLGEEIAALGFNMDFAPVSDVNNNPNNPIIGTRSFSDDPEMVSEHVTAFIRGLSKNNISAALKHFPGHGNVDTDSHTGLPLSELTLKQLKACELIPFQAGIDAGADMIMTAHIQFPNIEKNTYVSKADRKKVYLPATLSRTLMTDVLRKDMGYNGVIVTDAMDMSAITAHFDAIDAAVLAINADVDILLCSIDIYKDNEINTLPEVDAYMQKLLARVKAGDIKEEELDNSVARILKLKIKNGIMDNTLSVSKKKQIARAKAVVGSAEHHTREWEIAQQGITLLKNDGNMLPLDGKNGKKTLILIPSDYRRPAVEYAVTRLQKEGLADPSDITILSYSGAAADDRDILKAVKKSDRVLILSQSASRNTLLTNVIEQVHKSKKHRVALLSLGLPYDVACYPDADAAMCAYNYSGSAHDAEGRGPFNLNVAVAVCSAFGQSIPQGKLPVNIPKLTVDANGKNVYSDELLYERGAGINGLASWTRSSAVAGELKEYVEAVTKKNGKDYIPEEDRIAVFDLDGTLMCETYPRCFEYMVFTDYVLNNPDHLSSDEVKNVAREILDTAWQDKPQGISTRQAAMAAVAYKGLTPAELEEYVIGFMDSDAEGFTGMKRGKAFYKPMVEVVDYLRDNGFKIYIVTATERNIVRAIVKDTLGIAPSNVIGTEYGYIATNQGDTADTDYTFKSQDKVVFDGNYYGENAKMSKVDAIVREIGQQPVLAFGNSSGDTAMCVYTITNNPYRSLSCMVMADDEVREWGDETDAAEKRGTYEKLGIKCISMKNDFATIYGYNVKKDIKAPAKQ